MGFQVQQLTDNGYIVCGTAGTVPLFDMYVVRTDIDGNPEWEMSYGRAYADFGLCAQQCSSGGFIIAGATASYGAGMFDAYLVRVDHLGNILYTRSYGTGDSESAKVMRETADQGFVLAGTSIGLECRSDGQHRAVTLVDDLLASGRYTLTWDGRDAGGEKVSSGTYFNWLSSGNHASTRKLLLLQ
jgi:hypothetical protein